MPQYEERPEVRATSGVGCALYMKNSSNLYSFMLALETVPAFGATPESIEIDVTTSKFITRIEGKATLEEKEVDFFLHRDSIRKLQSLDGKIVELMRINPDYTGEKCNCQISFASQDATSGDPNKGTLKITPVEYLGFVDNCYGMLQPTVKFASAIDGVVEVDAAKSSVINIATDPADATVTVASEDEKVAKATFADGKLTISGVAAGAAVVVISAAKENFAPWETTVLVIVK